MPRVIHEYAIAQLDMETIVHHMQLASLACPLDATETTCLPTKEDGMRIGKIENISGVVVSAHSVSCVSHFSTALSYVSYIFHPVSFIANRVVVLRKYK